MGFALILTVADGDDFDFTVGETLFFEAKFLSGARGHVDDASRNEGSAIIDSHLEALAIFEVGDLHHAGDGQGFVGSRDVPRHHFFSKRSVAALEAEHGRFVIPRSDAALFVVQGLLDGQRLIVHPANGVGAGLSALVVAIVPTTGGYQKGASRWQNKSKEIFHSGSLVRDSRFLNGAVLHESRASRKVDYLAGK